MISKEIIFTSGGLGTLGLLIIGAKTLIPKLTDLIQSISSAKTVNGGGAAILNEICTGIKLLNETTKLQTKAQINDHREIGLILRSLRMQIRSGESQMMAVTDLLAVHHLTVRGPNLAAIEAAGGDVASIKSAEADYKRVMDACYARRKAMMKEWDVEMGKRINDA